MAQFFNCNRCRARVPFEDEDRGLDVYCPSCGNLCKAPLADEPGTPDPDLARSDTSPSNLGQHRAAPAGIESAETARAEGHAAAGALVASAAPASALHVSHEECLKHSGRRSVFSDEIAVSVAERLAGQVTCFCGERIKVRVEDYGGNVYCPSCGAEVRVGEKLDDRDPSKALRARQAEELPEAPHARFRLFASPLRALASSLVIAIAVAGAFLTWTKREEVRAALGMAAPPPGKTGEGVATEFRPEDLTAEIISQLTADEDPWNALKQAAAWTRGLSGHGVPAADARFQQLEQVSQAVLASHQADMLEQIAGLAQAADPAAALETAEQWDRLLGAVKLAEEDERRRRLNGTIRQLLERVHPITPEMIAGLLKREDNYDALADGQVWREELDARQVPQDDPRRPQLNGVIGELEKRLVPPPAKPLPCHAEFRDAVQHFFERLQADDLAGAKQAQGVAEGILKAHPKELADSTRRFFALKARLRERLLLTEGVARIRATFDQAEQLLADRDHGQVTAALETKARLALLVYITPVTPQESEEFTERMRGLTASLRFAMGKRAVADAERCHEAKDSAARDRQVSRAYELLPGFPENEITPLLERVKPWREEKEPKAPAPGRKRPPSLSPLGIELANREAYEEALQLYGKPKPAERDAFLAAACQAQKQISVSGRGQQLAENLEKLVLDFLESDLSLLLMMEKNLTGEEIAERLAVIGRSLRAAEPWKGRPRWTALDGAVRQRGDELAQGLIEKAKGVAAEDKLAEAVTLIAPAVALGLGSTAQRAEALHARWKKELGVRADRAAEAAAWQHIQTLKAAVRTLEVWQALDVYLQRYRQSPNRAEAERLQESIRKFMEERFNTELERVRSMAQAGHWSDVMQRIGLLRAAAVSPDQRAALQSLSELADQQKEKIENDYRLLGWRKQMFNEEAIIEVRRVAALYLAFHPSDDEAAALLEQAKQRGAERAAKLIEQGMRFRSFRPELFREKLTLAYHLDPGGEQGERARKLLQEG